LNESFTCAVFDLSYDFITVARLDLPNITQVESGVFHISHIQKFIIRPPHSTTEVQNKPTLVREKG
jgi:hypothetical protein